MHSVVGALQQRLDRALLHVKLAEAVQRGRGTERAHGQHALPRAFGRGTGRSRGHGAREDAAILELQALEGLVGTAHPQRPALVDNQAAVGGDAVRAPERECAFGHGGRAGIAGGRARVGNGLALDEGRARIGVAGAGQGQLAEADLLQAARACDVATECDNNHIAPIETGGPPSCIQGQRVGCGDAAGCAFQAQIAGQGPEPFIAATLATR